MNAPWPSTLPQFVLIDGFKESPPDNVIRTPMAVGPDKVRRRTTDGSRSFEIKIQIDSAQVVTLKTFHQTTLVGGTLKFDWVHPRTQAAATYRFASPPVFTAMGNGFWRAALKLQIPPN